MTGKTTLQKKEGGKRMKRSIRLGAFAVAFLAWSGTAHAQSGSDACSDILRNGTLRIEQLQNNRYYHQILASREIEGRTRDVDGRTSGSVAMPIQGIPISASGASSYRRYDTRSSDVSRFSEISEQNEVSAFLSTGDSLIVGAWERCMSGGRGGLTLRFVSTSAREATLLLSWRPGRAGTPEGHVEARLTEDYAFPDGIQVVSGRQCLLASHVLSEGACEVGLRLDSAMREVAVTLNTDHGVGAHAYLPPRLHYLRDSMPYEFTAVDRVRRSFHRQRGWIPVNRTVQLGAELASQGWRFDPDSVGFTVEKTYGGPHHRCSSAQVSQREPFQISYGYRALTSWEDRADRNTSVVCVGNPSARLIRDRWIPMD